MPQLTPVVPPVEVVTEQQRPPTPAVVAETPPPVVQIPPAPEPVVPGEDVVVTARDTRGDPAAAINAVSFDATQAVDDALIGPMSRAYTSALPRPVRDGVRNFLGNLREPIVAVNYLLQLKPGKAAETLGRFAINTTIGVAGFVDIAKRKPFHLPRRRNSFANTLALYGVKPGPFFFLPLIGATTLRDLIGSSIDQAMVPISSVPPLSDRTVAAAISGFSLLSYRADIDKTLKDVRAAPDPYAARRKAYLNRRQAEIDAIRGRKASAPRESVGEFPPSPLVP
ncbi:MAG: VacJ family lipoprotein [Sphingomonas bacterium]|nr:VacJ family lipoprotein [Sphingomonas bacterium]